MEATSYVQKTFNEVLNDLEKAERNQAVAASADTATQTIADTTSTVVDDTTLANNDTQQTAAGATEVKTDASDFNVGIEDDTEDTAQAADASTQPQYNWKEEIKKVDRKELLKEAGLTDFAIEMNEYLSKGGHAFDYLQAKAVDYNKISDEVLLKDALRAEYPNLSPSQIDLMYSRKYGVNEDASDEDKEFISMQQQADAYKIRQSKITEQQKFKIPDAPILQKDEAYEQWKQQVESQPKLMENIRNYYEGHAATKSLYESKRVTINLGEGVPPFNFNIDKPQMLNKALTDGGVILNKVTTTQSGEPDVAKQHLITLFSLNPDKFIQDIFKYGQSMGVRKELIEEGQNAQRPQAVVHQIQSDKPTGYAVGKYGNKGR